jgi:hypothetical protein
MEVHKPKPWHGVREFLKEYVIIVVGVLTALGAEQAVEWLHWRGEVARAEGDLRADAQVVLHNMANRLAIQPCLDRRLEYLQQQLLESGAGWKPVAPFITKGPPAGSAYAHPMVDWPRTAWTNAVATTTATHIPSEELTRYSRIFDTAARIAADQAAEHEVSSELNVLGAPVVLTPDQKVEFLRVIYAERARNRLIGYEAKGALPQYEALGFDVAKALQEGRDPLFYGACVHEGLA